MKMDNEKLIIL